MSKPDYEVKIKARDGKYGARVGAAWTNKAGGINIRLEAGVSVSTPEGVDLTLWPWREREESPRKADGGGAGGGRKAPGGFPTDDFGDDIPFVTSATVPRAWRGGA